MRIDDLKCINAEQTEVTHVQPLSVGIHDWLDLRGGKLARGQGIGIRSLDVFRLVILIFFAISANKVNTGSDSRPNNGSLPIFFVVDLSCPWQHR